MAQQECDIKKIIDALEQLQKQLPSTEKVQDQLKERPTSKKATVNNNEQPSERRSEEKRPSWSWDRLKERVKKIGKAKKEASNHASDSGGSQGGSRRSWQKIEADADLEIRKLQNDIRQMIAAFENLTQFQTNMKKNLEHEIPSNKLGAILKKKDSIKSRSHDLKDIRNKVFKLKCEIPSLLYKQSSRGLSVMDSKTAEENAEIVEDGSDIYLPSLHVSEDFKASPAFEDILEKFEDLDITRQLCLLSFAVFPENREIKRTMLMYWWIGEEFIFCDDSENEVTRILDEFSTKGLLEPVEDETKLKSTSYKMEPHVHSAVIELAEQMGIFKLYSSEGALTMEKSLKEKVCLVKGFSLEPAAKKSVMQPKTLQTIFNSSERYPDFTFKWFPLMDSLRVLYLGRWEQTANRHIEVESTKFLKDIKSLKNLRLASFQGISRIEQLEKYICKLSKLVILDLKACYNLESLPEDIGLLESLIYLDVSECYMLDRMPKGIEDLSKLQVLKGFVISQSDDESNCAVKKLVHLRKLSITVNKYSFTMESLMVSLSGLKQLESLKIAWGARFPEDDQEQKKGQARKEKKGDVEETGKGEDGASSKNEGGRNEEANLEEGNKHEEVKAESLKSDKVVEGEKKISPSQEATETIQNKTDDHKGKNKVEEEGDGDKGKADLEERKKQDELEAEKSKSDKVVEGEKKTTPPQESSDMIQKKPDDKTTVEKEGDGDKEKADLDEGKTQDEIEAERSKSDKVVKGDEKTSPPQKSEDKIQSKPDDKSKMEKEGDGDKGKADPEDGKKHDEVEKERSKSDKVVEGDEKTSPPQESKDTIQNKTAGKTKVEKEGDGAKGKADLEEGKKHDEIEAERSKSEKVVKGDEKPSPPQKSEDKIQSKPDDKSKMEKEGDGDKGKADPEVGKKHDEVETERSKSDKVVEGDEKTSPPQESKDTIQNKTAGKTKVEKEGDGATGKADPEKGKKHDEVEAESSKSDNGVEGVEKARPRELTDAIQNKPDDHQRDEKQEEKGNGEKEKVNLEEGKKKDEVKSESSIPEKVIEGDEKTSPPKDSIDTILSKPDDHREISKVHEKGDGEKNGNDLKKLDGVEAKTQKSDKTTKFRKKVSFSENTETLIQKKPDDLKRDNTMGGESHETPSPSRPHKESKLKRKLTQIETAIGKEAKKFGKRLQDNQTIDTSKLPSSLKKLELECFPDKDPPSWLNPENLKNLKKLSIRGGKLSRIGGEKKWPVQILRLKYLHEFKVEWRNLKALFPNMTLLEKYECPKIALCPTDGNGVWRSQPQKSPNM